MKAVILFTMFFAFSAVACAQQYENAGEMKNVHHFSVATIDGVQKALAEYEGQVLLLVNTASKCGFTPQYKGLQELYTRYADRGFRILAFPANDFGAQEPGSNEEIKEFCEMNFGVTFDMFSKISVKGSDMHPLYAWLTQESEFKGDIRWNFTKFLVDGDGKVIARYETRVDPLDAAVTEKLEAALPQ
jgi:glutathione peroxidase